LLFQTSQERPDDGIPRLKSKFAWFPDSGQTVPVRSLYCLPHANEPVRLLKRSPQLGYSSRSPREFVEVRSGLGIALPISTELSRFEPIEPTQVAPSRSIRGWSERSVGMLIRTSKSSVPAPTCVRYEYSRGASSLAPNRAHNSKNPNHEQRD
jgi:hypothetical protein